MKALRQARDLAVAVLYLAAVNWYVMPADRPVRRELDRFSERMREITAQGYAEQARMWAECAREHADRAEHAARVCRQSVWIMFGLVLVNLAIVVIVWPT